MASAQVSAPIRFQTVTKFLSAAWGRLLDNGGGIKPFKRKGEARGPWLWELPSHGEHLEPIQGAQVEAEIDLN